MKRTNWHWDIPLPYKKIVKILKRDDDPRFPWIAGALLSRSQDPKQVFELITPISLCRHYRAIAREILSDAWTKEKAAFWKATFIRLSKELQEKGIKVRQRGRVKLDDFDKDLVVKIRGARKQALMSQQELAKFMGCSQQYVSGVESGRDKVSLDYLKKLAIIIRAHMEIAFQPEKQT